MLIKFVSFISFLLMWFLLAGPSLSMVKIFFSVAAASLTLALCHWWDLLPKKVKINYHFPLYCLWLIKEIIKSTIIVTKIVWQEKLNIDPTFEWVESEQDNVVSLVIFGNSITLTPGTVTLDIKDNMLLVHALEKSSLPDLAKMDAKIQRIVC